MKHVLQGALLATLLFAVPAARAEDQTFSYGTVLHAYWKLSPPKSYERFAEGYAQEFPELAVDDPKEMAEIIEENVDDTDLDDAIVISTHVQVGQYMPAQQAYVFAPFHAGVYFPTASRGGRIPHPNVVFSNGENLKSLPLPLEEAKKFQRTDGEMGLQYDADVRFVPVKAMPMSNTLQGRILDMTLRTGQKPLVVLKFDEDTGDLKSAEFVGDKAAANNEDKKDE